MAVLHVGLLARGSANSAGAGADAFKATDQAAARTYLVLLQLGAVWSHKDRT
jgi:hypothetical protein